MTITSPNTKTTTSVTMGHGLRKPGKASLFNGCCNKTNPSSSSSTFSSSRKVVCRLPKNLVPLPPVQPTEKRPLCSSSDFDSEIETWFMDHESKMVKRQRIISKIDDIHVDAHFKKHGPSDYGGKLGLKKKLEGGSKKKVDGGLGSKKNKVDNGLGLKRKFEGALGLNKEVEDGYDSLICTPSISSCEVSSSQSCSNFMSGCETPVTIPHLPPSRASPVQPASSASDHEINNNTSPRRAARVAMLKARFANTILKAEHHVLYTTTITTDAKNARLEAAEAEILRANDFIKKQRQRDREAARLALEEMEKHVVVEDNFKTMRDFDILISGAKIIDFGRLLLGEIVYSDL